MRGQLFFFFFFPASAKQIEKNSNLERSELERGVRYIHIYVSAHEGQSNRGDPILWNKVVG